MWADEDHVCFEAIESAALIRIGNSRDVFQLMGVIGEIYQHT